MSLQAVYESDKRIAEVTRDMTIAGIGWDADRAARFADMLRQQESDSLMRAEAALNRKLKRTKTGGVSTDDLQRGFFDDLGVPALFLSELTGKPSLSALALQAYAATQNLRLRALATAELERRRARKIRGTYIDAIKLGADSRVHPGWKNYGTVSGRWACAGPNLANLPGARIDPCRAEGGIRSLYIPRPGYVFVYYDHSQIEFRIAAYGSGDDNMIAACEAGDVHSANASILFPGMFDAADYKRLKRLHTRTEAEEARFAGLDGLRTLAKSSVFAVCYLAEAPTVHERIVSQGINVKLRQVETMLSNLKSKCRDYYRWQSARLLGCVREGYTTSPILGRRRHLGHEPSPPECANFPIQSGAADVMNAEIPRLLGRLRTASPRTRAVAHVYDSVLLEVPQAESRMVQDLCVEEATRPVTICSSGRPRECVLPVDIAELDRWH